jgi:hypothetical protein
MLKKAFLVIILCSAFAYSQQIDKITRRCPSPNGSSFASALVTIDGDINYTPCPSRSNILSGNVSFAGGIHLIDNAYTNALFPNNFFSIGKASNVNYTNGFGGIVLDNNLNATGAGQYFVGQYNNIAVGGSATTANIFGDLIAVSNRANGVVLGSTSTIEGVDIFTNIETPTTTGYGVFAYASTGSIGAAGSGTISALNGTGGIHNGGATLVNAGEFRAFNSASGAAVATTQNILRAYLTNNVGNTITNLHGLSFDSWSNSGTVSGGSVIFADSSVDVTGLNYFINSASTKPSKVAGDVFVSDNTKGIILKSPDGTCYRFTVANGGALNAGVGVTCP